VEMKCLLLMVAPFLLVTGCGPGLPDEGPVAEGERVGASRGEMRAAEGTTIKSPTIEAQQEAIKEAMTGWVVLLSRTGDRDQYVLSRQGQKRYWSDPGLIDDEAALVAVRKKDVEKRDWNQMIRLSVRDMWLHGDAYVNMLVSRHHLTPLDIIGIIS